MFSCHVHALLLQLVFIQLTLPDSPSLHRGSLLFKLLSVSASSPDYQKPSVSTAGFPAFFPWCRLSACVWSLDSPSLAYSMMDYSQPSDSWTLTTKLRFYQVVRYISTYLHLWQKRLVFISRTKVNISNIYTCLTLFPFSYGRGFQIFIIDWLVFLQPIIKHV